MRRTFTASPVGLGLIALAAMLLVAPAASAQQTGGIAGQVTDTTGGALPGVTVEVSSPALIGGTQVAFTDGEGRYLASNLPPGPYAVTFTLPGFSTIVRDGIDIGAGFTAGVDVELSVGAVEETITVTGAAPVVDVQTVRQQRTLPQEEIEALPTANIGLQTLASVTPGFQGAGADVGGTRDTWSAQGQYQNYHGKDGTRAAFNGFRNQYFIGSASGVGYITNSDTVGELQLEITGMGAENGSGSTSLNAIAREGSNTFTSTINTKYSGASMQGENILGDPDLTEFGLTSGEVESVYRIGATVGGPLVQDKLWFFGSVARWGTSSLMPGAFHNSRQGETAEFTRYHEFDRSRPASNFDWNRTHALRLTYQASERNRFGFFGDVQKNCRCTTGFTGSNSIEYETGWDWWPAGVIQGTWTNPVTSRVLLEAGWGWQTTNWVNFNSSEAVRDGVDRNMRNLSQGFQYGAPFVMIAPQARTGRGEQYFTLSYVTGSHNMKIGLTDGQGFNDESRSVTGPDNLSYMVLGDLDNPVPFALLYHASPFFQQERANHEIGLYAQDAWTLDRLTINLGLRFDWLTMGYPAASLGAGSGANAAIPARSVSELSGVPDWKDVNPRLGMSYDLFGTGRTALKVSLGRYLELSRSDFTRQFHPFTSSVRVVNRRWNDDDGDFEIDGDASSRVANGELGPMSNNNFGNFNATLIDDGTYRGVENELFHRDITNANRTYLWDFLLEVQHELFDGFSISANYNRNWAGGFRVKDNTAVEPSDFDEFCVPIPNDAFFGARAGGQQCGYYDVSKAKFGAFSNINTTASTYGDHIKKWEGFVFSLDGRFPNGATLAGGIDVGQQTQSLCYTIDIPNQPREMDGNFHLTGGNQLSSDFCNTVRTYGDLADFRIRGSYPIPGDFNFAWIWRDQPGQAVNPTMGVARGDATFVDPARTDPLNANSMVVNINPLNSVFTDRLRQLDIRFTRTFNMSGIRLDTSIDLYNALNNNPVLTMINRVGGRFLTPLTVLDARLLQFYAQINF